MLWRRSIPQNPRSPGPKPVPDTNELRRAALQASWQRDRRVAQRRMAMRWALWYGARAVPVLVVAGAVAALVWLWVMPRLPGTALNLAAPQSRPARAPVPVTVPLPVTVPVPAPVPIAPTIAPPTPTPQFADPAYDTSAVRDSKPRESGLQLILESPLRLAPTSDNSPAVRERALDKHAVAKNSPSPQLKPDSWLHSQEP